MPASAMYRPASTSSLKIIQKAFSEGPAGETGPESIQHRFHELGYAIVKSNLAIKYPDFHAGKIKRQYEQMLGIKLDGRYDPGLRGLIDPCELDVLGRLSEEASHMNGTGKGAGEFYTPPFVVDYMVSLTGLDADDSLRERKFIDIACGPGAFIIAGMRKAIRSLTKQGLSESDILRYATGNFYGLDISRVACDICKINMYLVLLDELGPDVLSQAGRIRFNVFRTSSIDNRDSYREEDTEAAMIKHRLGQFAGGFDYVMGNPPYLEAKKMPAPLREACRECWPGSIKGAFDLYIPFILQSNRLAADGGKVCLILPDKFTVARYAMHLREKLLQDCSLIELADLSETDVFERATVYPVVLAYEKKTPVPGHMLRTRISVRSPEELADSDRTTALPQDLYRSIGHNQTFFCLPGEGDIADMLRRIFGQGTPIGNYVSFRSAVSFHKKGLREQYVRQSFDDGAGPMLKYLGGRSYAKRNEVDLFEFRWKGYYIRYDQAGLKSHNNPLPPLSNFMQEKIVLCQHAPRITAAYDGRGEYVTKDVYPIGIAEPCLAGSSLSLKYFAVLLNSELMSFVYGTVYKGIQIGGGYYHYLPTWIDILPVIMPDKKDIKGIDRLANEMISASNRAEKLQLMKKADDIIYEMYGIDKMQRSIISKSVPPWNLAGD